jgi:hypothetical protein
VRALHAGLVAFRQNWSVRFAMLPSLLFVLTTNRLKKCVTIENVAARDPTSARLIVSQVFLLLIEMHAVDWHFICYREFVMVWTSLQSMLRVFRRPLHPMCVCCLDSCGSFDSTVQLIVIRLLRSQLPLRILLQQRRNILSW